MPGHPDQIGHRQQRSSPRRRESGLVLEVLHTRRDDDGHRKAVVPAQCGIPEEAAGHRGQRVVPALPGGAVVAVRLLRRRVALHAR